MVCELNAPDSMTWSVSLRDRHDRDIEGDVSALLEAIGGVIAEHLPEADGYETVWYRLSGPIEGATVRVCRGRFRATASVQRFVRAHASCEADRRAAEVRLVATAELAAPEGSAPSPSTGPGAAGHWAAASCAVSTAVFGTLALAAGGLLTAWVQALLVLPTLLVWRTTLALSRPAPGALGPSVDHVSCGRPCARDPRAQEAMAEWRGVLAQLRAHRQLLDQPSSLAPFRAPPRSLGATG